MFEKFEKTPVTDGVVKRSYDLSINVDVKFMWLYWSYEYLTEVSEILLDLRSEYNLDDTIFKGTASQVKIIDNGKHSIEFLNIKINNKDELIPIIEKLSLLIDGTCPTTIKLKVGIVDYLIFQDMYFIGYVYTPDEKKS